jgi:hypothetical protein
VTQDQLMVVQKMKDGHSEVWVEAVAAVGIGHRPTQDGHKCLGGQRHTCLARFSTRDNEIGEDR